MIVKDVVCGDVEIPSSGSVEVCSIDIAKIAKEGSDYLLVVESSGPVSIELRLGYDGSLISTIAVNGVTILSGDIVNVPLKIVAFGVAGTRVKVVARVIGG